MTELNHMRKISCFVFSWVFIGSLFAQTPKSYNAADILQQLKKLPVLGSVLYIAAHPDDENTRLLGYLANEKLYRTGYLSLTRGDGGQNLIGDEQGIDLGLIRTQELLAARRIDGAEQFFSRAYDFGFCKSPEEALATWGHDKILADVVWVIRQFKPDVIIARFPEDSRAGHGHHAASGILAREAFDAAADPTKFPEQLKYGVTVWQAKRMLWNTFNFGGGNTTSEDQFKLEVGMFNPLLGKGYGEIAALSRSEHKSQGFGVPANRGNYTEFFTAIKGDQPKQDLLDGVDITWNRVKESNLQAETIIQQIIQQYDPAQPARSVPLLIQFYQQLKKTPESYWRNQKLKEVQQLIAYASGLYMEATTSQRFGVQGDSLRINLFLNSRQQIDIKKAKVVYANQTSLIEEIKTNVNYNRTIAVALAADAPLSQPYWLVKPMEKGSFVVDQQQLIGKAENDPL
ncbi:MAG: hypothetical protein RLY16_384, partial [Bacteroidota bacterium]